MCHAVVFSFLKALSSKWALNCWHIPPTWKGKLLEFQHGHLWSYSLSGFIYNSIRDKIISEPVHCAQQCVVKEGDRTFIAQLPKLIGFSMCCLSMGLLGRSKFSMTASPCLGWQTVNAEFYETVAGVSDAEHTCPAFFHMCLSLPQSLMKNFLDTKWNLYIMILCKVSPSSCPPSCGIPHGRHPVMLNVQVVWTCQKT